MSPAGAEVRLLLDAKAARTRPSTALSSMKRIEVGAPAAAFLSLLNDSASAAGNPCCADGVAFLASVISERSFA